MKTDHPSGDSSPRGATVALSVPESVNLEKLSDQEIEHLALDLARKAASGLPRGAALRGVSAVSLVQQRAFGIGIGWERACDMPDLDSHDILINPAEYRSPINRDVADISSARYAIKAQSK